MATTAAAGVLPSGTVIAYAGATLKRVSARVILDKKTGQPVAIPNFLSAYELHRLLKSSSKMLGIHSQSVQAAADEYVRRRKQFHGLLRWRGRDKLGWIPFKAVGIRFEGDAVLYAGHRFPLWRHRDFPEDAKIKAGSFTQDSLGRWYITVTFESDVIEISAGGDDVGIDIGIKTMASLSDGTKVDGPRLREKFLEKLRKYEKTRSYARRKQAKSRRFGRLPKEKQVAKLHAKVANCRKDHLHKESRRLVEGYKDIFIGDVPCALMNRSKNMSGISLDQGIGMFKDMLRYKAARAGTACEEVSERDSTQTCSACGHKLTGDARIGLGVREWVCPHCHIRHDRDSNAAKNILQRGAYSPSHGQGVLL